MHAISNVPAIYGEYKPMSLIVFAWSFKLNQPSFRVDTLPLAVKSKDVHCEFTVDADDGFRRPMASAPWPR